MAKITYAETYDIEQDAIIRTYTAVGKAGIRRMCISSKSKLVDGIKVWREDPDALKQALANLAKLADGE